MDPRSIISLSHVLAGRIGNISTEISQHINAVAKEDTASKRMTKMTLAIVSPHSCSCSFGVWL